MSDTFEDQEINQETPVVEEPSLTDEPTAIDGETETKGEFNIPDDLSSIPIPGTSESDDSDDTDEDDDSENQEGEDDIEKSKRRLNHLRKIEKKQRKENFELKNRLTEAENKINQFSTLFQSTYENSIPQDSQPVQPKDEIEKKVSEVFNQKMLEQQRLAEQQELMYELAVQSDQLMKRYPDFQETLKSSQLPSEITNVLHFFDNAMHVAYSLSKQPDAVKKIMSLTGIKRGQALTRYSNELAIAASKKKLISNAPQPAQNTSSKFTTAAKKPITSMSASEILDEIYSDHRASKSK